MDVHVHLLDLDTMIHEQVVACPDGTFSVLINARLDHEARLRAYGHALRHIEAGDFDYDQVFDVDALERRAHEMEDADAEKE